MESKLKTTSSNGRDTSIKSILLASNRGGKVDVFKDALKKGTLLVNYSYEDHTLQNVIDLVHRSLKGCKTTNVAFLLHSSETEIFLCASGNKLLTVQSVRQDKSVRDFFEMLIRIAVKISPKSCIDFINCDTMDSAHGSIIIEELENLLNVPVNIFKDYIGKENSSGSPTYTEQCSYYFDTKLLATVLNNEKNKTNTNKPKTLEGYEKIRTVGKGAFGTAYLYSRKSEDKLVIIKEINMHDLTAAERQLALNEVKVLSMMKHPNIISYYNSFELEGVLMIEMEYADGGTLAQYLTQQRNKLKEKDILHLFQQIVSATNYMHDGHVLHRDLKTANIFLTKDNVVKVGDLGISKMLTTKQGAANTVLGTPYYISPEMCEGKEYDQKSDIWALGCILYEMACLQRTFDGSNLPALVNKIMKGHFEPIKGDYSPGFRRLVQDLLQIDAECRPSAAELLDHHLPQLVLKLEDALDISNSFINVGVDVKEDNVNGMHILHKKSRSVLYQINAFESTISLSPISLPPRSKVIEVCISNTHMIALTEELVVFTWGEDKKGQLGHGQLEDTSWVHTPLCVEVLKGKAITSIGAGDGFSVFASDTGMVMTCGDGTFGCLGHGDWNNCSKPKLMDKLLSVDVKSISCGSQHVVVLTREGDCYSWGRGNGGRLGIGREDDCCTPNQIPLADDILIRLVRCGGDGTIFISEEGNVYACGNNDYNKLALNHKSGFMAHMRLFGVQSNVDKALNPTRMKGVPSGVIDASLGPHHSALITDVGNLITFGKNSDGQLGQRHTYHSPRPSAVNKEQNFIMVRCGPTFTMAATIDNAVYFWGTRYISPLTHVPKRTFSEMLRSRYFSNSKSDLSSSSKSLPPVSTMLWDDTNECRTNSASSESEILDLLQTDIKLKYPVLEPQEILALYASPSQILKGETVSMSSLHSQHQNVYITVDTTAPLAPAFPSRSRNHIDRDGYRNTHQGMKPSKGVKLKASTIDENEFYRREGSNNADMITQMDTMGPVPGWLQEELANSDAEWKSFVEHTDQEDRFIL